MLDAHASVLDRPWVPQGVVPRTSLVDGLTREASASIVSVVAPAGYGKTTLLVQWAERAHEAFAWVSVDANHDDPKALLGSVAEALDAVEPLGERVFEALASPVSSVLGSVLPRVASAFSSMATPAVLVVDDVHLLHDPECRAALSVLADHVPGGSRLVLAGRTRPPLRVARLRLEGRILEIGPRDLALTLDEAARLLSGAGVTLEPDAVAQVHQRTEGWPVGLYLAALSLRQGGSVGTATGFGGNGQLLAQYMESEYLTRIPQRHRAFLTRAAVLDRISGPLCAAVLGEPDSAQTLAQLAGSNLLLVPLDRRREWYRYHQLFRELLLAELHREEPDVARVLRRRAAEWCLQNDRPEEALEYWMAAEDVDTVARMTEQLLLPTYRRGRVATVLRWLRWLEDHDGLTAHPLNAVWASLLYAVTGRSADSERLAHVVDGLGTTDDASPATPFTDAWVSTLRALLCRHGAQRMLADADEAVRRCAAVNILAPSPLILRGVARILRGDLQGADADLQKAVGAADQVGADGEVLAEALGARALLAMNRGDWTLADALSARTQDVIRHSGTNNLVASAAVARAALHHRDITTVRHELVAAQRARPRMTYVRPYFAVQARIELVRVHVALGDVLGARTLLREIDEVLRRRPDLGSLTDEAVALRRQVAEAPAEGSPGVSSLTTAELRVLPMLATHLSLPQIATAMFLSPHTVKAHAHSIYRKVGVSSRSQAVDRSRQLGLLEV